METAENNKKTPANGRERKHTETVRHEEDELQDELIKTDYIEDESLRLTPAQLQAIEESAEIKKLLEDPSVRQKVENIDNSRMRLHMLQNSLLHSDFKSLTDRILESIGKKEY